MISRILVSGVSGPIGTALLPSLRGNGCSVVRLVRGPISASSGSNSSGSNSKDQQISWDPAEPISPETVSGFDAVIHLAGESIMGRWTADKKEKIRDSRVVGTFNLSSALAQAPYKPQVLICGSASGYYGDRGDEPVNEDSAPGTGFLAEVCQDWEEATTPAVQTGIRTAHIRTGIVLSPKGGALGAMVTPFRLGLGGRIGSGRQWMSWIDVQDMVGAIHHILKNSLIQGAVNMVAPKPVRNEEFVKTLAAVLSRPAIFPVPEFAVKLLFGEMGDAVLLGGVKVEPAKLISTGYPFRFRDLRTSLQGCLK